MYRLAEIMMKGIHGLSPARTSMAMGIVLFCACTFLKRGERMYYSYENCLEKKALFNFITGERGNGKTYGFKTQIACKNYFEKDENFSFNSSTVFAISFSSSLKMKILFIYEDLKQN